MVSEGKLYYIIFFVFGQKILVFYYCQLCVDRCQVNKDIFYDRCLCHMFYILKLLLADVIAKDVMAVLPCHRWYSHHN